VQVLATGVTRSWGLRACLGSLQVMRCVWPKQCCAVACACDHSAKYAPTLCKSAPAWQLLLLA
jgi:hypothetical protein